MTGVARKGSLLVTRRAPGGVQEPFRSGGRKGGSGCGKRGVRCFRRLLHANSKKLLKIFKISHFACNISPPETILIYVASARRRMLQESRDRSCTRKGDRLVARIGRQEGGRSPLDQEDRFGWARTRRACIRCLSEGTWIFIFLTTKSTKDTKKGRLEGRMDALWWLVSAAYLTVVQYCPLPTWLGSPRVLPPAPTQPSPLRQGRENLNSIPCIGSPSLAAAGEGWGGGRWRTAGG